MSFHPGQLVRDTVDGAALVVVEDRGPRVLVAGMDSLRHDATLVQRAQWVRPAADLEAL